ncbi:MAG: hypothetical protein RIT45_1083, partial [Pseudomonadota bacterium]
EAASRVHPAQAGNGARYIARYSAAIQLLWKIPHTTYPFNTWQPFVPTSDTDFAAVFAVQPMTQPKLLWRRLTDAGTATDSGTILPENTFATGANSADSVLLAWLDGQTLRVERHAWPMTW